MTKQERTVMCKSLKFVPDPIAGNEIQRRTDIRKFCNKLRQYEHFSDKQEETNITTDNEDLDGDEEIKRPLFKNPTRWQPPHSKDKIFTAMLDNIMTQSSELMTKKRPHKNNVSNNQRFAINSLKKNADIVIKTADKGGATVLIDKKDYHDAMRTLLSDSATYQKVEEVKLEELVKKVNKFVKSISPALSEKEIDYLMNHENKLAYIYGLPKIHKSKKLKEELKKRVHTRDDVFHYNFKELNIPFRPIVSGTKCPLKRLCKLAKLLLRPLEREINHLIVDTFDFLKKLPSEIRGNPTLVAVDIVQLYPSIDNELGIEAISYWYRKFPEKAISGFDEDFVIRLLKFIQENVFMTFNDDTYKQIQGTAMGKDHAPPYANLVIAYLITERLYPKLEMDHGRLATSHIQDNLKLFLDDGFIMLEESILTAKEFLTRLNAMDHRIQFTMETSKEEIPFLDVLIRIKSDIYDASLKKIECDIFHKPTDAFNYFNFESCAPGHIPRNVPYNLARRIATIVSKKKLREERLEELRPRLKGKGYPEDLVKDAIAKAKTLNREDLINSRKKRSSNDRELTLVIDYDPRYEDPSTLIRNVFNQTFTLTEKYKAGKLQTPRLITARRQPPNLARILSLNQTRDHTLSINTKDGMFTRCEDARCKLCENVITDKSYTTKNGTILKRNANMNCKSKDLIYVLICGTCNMEYIGETGIKLNERMNLHRSQMTNPRYRILNVSKHLNDCGNNNFKVFPFLKCYKNCNIYREETEKHWRDIVQPGLH